jgi:IclR family mhp operon transcriptional activator
MDERQEVKSLKKALRALTFLNCHGESTVTEVATAIGVPRTTSYRLLETLASEGYVEKQPHSHIYRLTSLVQKLSSGFGDCDLVVEVAKPLINRVGDWIRWPLALATPVGSDMMVRIATDFDTPLAIDRYYIGFRTPMLHAPAGLAYLAHCSDQARASILDLVQRSGETANEPAGFFGGLDYRLDLIRSQGFCHIRFAQYREGGLAVPLIVDGCAIGGIVQKLAADIVEAYKRRLTSSRAAVDDALAQEAAPFSEELPAPPFPFAAAPPAAAAALHYRQPAISLQRALR